MSGQLPSGSGSSMPSHSRRVEPLRPAWASWMPILAGLAPCTKSTMRFHAATCSGVYMPVQPGLMRPSRLTSVISVITSPAPPTARLPRCTRCQSPGVPSSAEYWHIGETTTRLGSTQLAQPERREHRRRRRRRRHRDAALVARPVSANQRSTVGHELGVARLRFSCVTRRLRVSRLKANWTGSRRPW